MNNPIITEMEEKTSTADFDCATFTSQDNATLKQSNVTLPRPKLISEIINSLGGEYLHLINLMEDNADIQMKNLVQQVVVENHNPTGDQKSALFHCANSSWRQVFNQISIPQIDAAARSVGSTNEDETILEADLEIFDSVKNNTDEEDKSSLQYFLLWNSDNTMRPTQRMKKCLLFECAISASGNMINRMLPEQLEHAAWYICGAREVLTGDGQISALTEIRTENLRRAAIPVPPCARVYSGHLERS